YGTSRLFARSLSSAIIVSGSRSEIVRNVGRKFGRVSGRASDQSRYSAESSRPQKARSAASSLNAGIFFRELINFLFTVRHVAKRYRPDEPISNRECHEKQTPAIRLSQNVKANLTL